MNFRITLSTALLCSLALPLSAAEVQDETIEKGDFRFAYDERGVVGLANPHDPFGAQIVPRDQRLSLAVRYRVGAGEWQTLPTTATRKVSPESGVTYSTRTADNALDVEQTFKTDGATLDWGIDLATTTNAPVEIGDLSISIPAAGPRGEEPKQIFERGFVRHQFISGHGSFVYFVRASGAPPFLLVTVRPGTKLEFFGNEI